MKDELQPTGYQQKNALEAPRALVGWSHMAMPNKGISLRVECARSRLALENELIEERHIVMTHNQALLLARYLLKVTGQTLHEAPRPTLWSRLRSAIIPTRAAVRRTEGSLAS